MNYFNQNIYAYVNGIEGAKAYQVMPNQNVLLIDMDSPTIYMKSANSMGQSTIEYFRIEQIKEDDLKPKNEANFATKEQLDEIIERLEKIEKGE